MNEVIFVRQGLVRLQKTMTFQEHNINPSEEFSAPKKPKWDMHKRTKEQELNVLRIYPKTFIGVQEVNANTKFMEGSLYVEEDDTILCYISKVKILEVLSDKELTKLLK